MVSSYRLTKQAKMIKTDDFSSVFSFHKRVASAHLVMHYRPNHLALARLGLVVGKKTAKLAVSRNYMKRVLRELFRHKQHEVSHVDLIVRVQKPFNRSEYKQIQQEFELLITKLNQKVILNAQTLSPVNAAPLLG